MKRRFYIFSFTILGVLISFVAHAVIEIFYIKLLISDFSRFGFGLTWSSWFRIHVVFTIILFILGAALGCRQGIYWWRRLYE